MLFANVVLPGLQVYASTLTTPSESREIVDWAEYKGTPWTL